MQSCRNRDREKTTGSIVVQTGRQDRVVDEDGKKRRQRAPTSCHLKLSLKVEVTRRPSTGAQQSSTHVG